MLYSPEIQTGAEQNRAKPCRLESSKQIQHELCPVFIKKKKTNSTLSMDPVSIPSFTTFLNDLLVENLHFKLGGYTFKQFVYLLEVLHLFVFTSFIYLLLSFYSIISFFFLWEHIHFNVQIFISLDNFQRPLTIYGANNI